jgi:hypothetical protein
MLLMVGWSKDAFFHQMRLYEAFCCGKGHLENLFKSGK